MEGLQTFEMWVDVPNWEGVYQVSTLGRVKSLARKFVRKTGNNMSVQERILKQGLNERGYPIVKLQNEGFKRTRTVHRIVAETLIPNPLKLREVNHKDLNKENNSVANLEWCTRKHNIRHYWDQK